MNIDPAYAPAMEVATFNEGHNLRMRNHRGLKHLFVIGQELLAPAAIANQEFPVDQVVSSYIFDLEQLAQSLRERRAASQSSNPDRRVHQDH